MTIGATSAQQGLTINYGSGAFGRKFFEDNTVAPA
jgi:hypothetical protein